MRKEQLVNRYINQVVKDLINLYSLNEWEAKRLVKRIDLISMLNEFPDETTHYPTDYWAEKIYNDMTQLV
ncbi:hypothetical protein [Virgibacillus sp. L01]|uniref:hypothetical protein n=1 Tax=Virgibacillus sp. L01 TaxID=3457429 RepID=UPI003FD04B55